MFHWQIFRQSILIEPYEDRAAVSGVLAVDEDQVKVVLKDGRVQTVGVLDMEDADGGKVRVVMRTSKCNHAENR